MLPTKVTPFPANEHQIGRSMEAHGSLAHPSSVTERAAARGGLRSPATAVGQRRARTDALLRELAKARGPARENLRAEVIELNLDVVRSVCGRYRNRGVVNEDLQQVAAVGLMKAIDRFDPHAGFAFLSYAVPTIRGEVRRYFRDQAWTVRPPRSVQEMQAGVQKAAEELFQQLGRSPRPNELAEHLGAGLDEVIEAMSARGCFQPASLDRPMYTDSAGTLGDSLVADDSGDWGPIEARMTIRPALAILTDRERHVLKRRFVDGLTQSQIGAEIGVTQMHISRIISRALARMREEMEPGSVRGERCPGRELGDAIRR